MEAIGKILNGRKTIYPVLLLCFGLRVAFSIHAMHRGAVGDELLYTGIGANIAHGYGFVRVPGTPTAYGNFLYPMILSALFRLFGTGLLSVFLFHCVLDTLSCLLVYLIGNRVSGRAAVGVVAATLFAVYPPLAMTAATALTEPVGNLLTLLAVYGLVRAADRSAKHYILPGIASGLLILIKPSMLGFPVFVCLAMLIMRAKITSPVRKGLVFALVSYLVVAPWTIRNFIVMNAFIPVSTHGGSTMWGGTGPADGVIIGGYGIKVDTQRNVIIRGRDVIRVRHATAVRIADIKSHVAHMSEAENDAYMKQQAIDEIKAHPGRYAYLGIRKFCILWFNLWNDAAPSKSSLCLATFNFAAILLAVLAMRKRTLDAWFVALLLTTFVYTSIVSVVVTAVVRYSYAVYPLVFVASAAAFVTRQKLTDGVSVGAKPNKR